MYQKILVTLDHTSSDEAVLRHIEELHQHISSEIVLLHVADGWAARYQEDLRLKESEEMREDQAYLEKMTKRLQQKGIATTHQLATGDPAKEIVRFAKECRCDLIAMSTHGHRFLQDLIYGATATKVRHQVDIPVLLVKASNS